MDDVQIVLPWPPSVNGYWRSYRGRQILSQKARVYRQSAGHKVSNYEWCRHWEERK